jgi:hypothetical protein
MNWLQFVASIIESLAWPIACVVLVFLLRKPLTQILIALTRLKNLKFKELELDFGAELRDIKDTAAGSIAPEAFTEESLPTVEQDIHSQITEAKRLAPDFPEPAISVGWQAVEEALFNAVDRLRLTPTNRSESPPLRNIELLSANGYIHTENVSVLRRMRKLRNIAVHGGGGRGEISVDDANEFIALASAIVKTLNEIKKPE